MFVADVYDRAHTDPASGPPASFTLTVCPQEVVEQLEEREAVPAVGRLNLQSCVHVSRVQTQEGLCVFHHQVRPPRKGLRTESTDEDGRG